MDPVLLATTLIVVFGVAGQFVGRLAGVPSLLVLLAFGAVLGPGLGWLDPSEAYGQDVVLTLASLGVGLLLFEGGLQLRWSELHAEIRRPLVLLITLGVLLTVVAGSALCLWVLDVSTTQALLLGAILSVSGPTVVGPLLRASKPREPAGMLLRWESILIDPIGAMLSVTVLSVWFVVDEAHGIVGFLLASVGGVSIGFACAAALVLLLRVGTPDDLEVAIILATAIGAYALGEWWHSEAGLFATTTLGLILANQRVVGVQAAEVFSGVISVLVIGALFITLVSEVDLSAIGDLVPEIVIICAGLLVTRQVVVHVCTARGTIDETQRLFMGLMGPRGVVAAATAASFSLTLDDRDLGFPELVAVTYGVIIGMGVLACLTIPAAGWLRVRRPQRHGLLMIGSEDWTAQLASAIAATGVTVYLLAPGREDIDEVEHVRLQPSTMEELSTAPLVDEVEYCLIGLGSIEMRGYAWTLTSERIGRRRCLVIPKPGLTPPGVTTIWRDIPADAFRSSSFVARRAGHHDEPTLGEIRLVRVGHDGSLDFDPYRPSDHDADGWLVVARARVGVRMSGADPLQRPQAPRP
ncbi:MAG: cation:proton antiporter [Candidatus Nanopelagicales bacterium]